MSNNYSWLKGIVILATTVVSTLAGSAQPSGTYSWHFTDFLLWDFTGQYVRTVEAETVTVDIAQSTKGSFTGSRYNVYEKGPDHFQGFGSIKGILTVSKGTLTLRASSKSSYSGRMNGTSFTGVATSKDSLTLVPSTLSAIGESTVKMCITGRKCTTGYDGYQLPLVNGMDGTWTLSLDVNTTANKIVGNGRVTLSNGRVLNYLASGKYDAKKALSFIKLKGQGEAAGTDLSFNLGLGEQGLSKIKGKVLGQKVSFR